VAKIIQIMHHSPLLQNTLPAPPAQEFSLAGLTALEDIQRRWLRYRPLVPDVAEFIDKSLETLERQVHSFTGSGLVASHNDICNANWLVTEHGRWYLVDLEAMALGDPALDIGATLWWYYPARLRPRFLEISGYAGDEAFARRMQVRMAMHCLHILLPRKQSFDHFSSDGFITELVDFRAALAGEENPQGYED
jgi:thiamine kinase-like enzyme